MHDSKIWDVLGKNWRCYKRSKIGYFALKNGHEIPGTGVELWRHVT